MRTLVLATIQEANLKVGQVEFVHRTGTCRLRTSPDAFRRRRWSRVAQALSKGTIDIGLDAKLQFITGRGRHEKVALLSTAVQNLSRGKLHVVPRSASMKKARARELELAYNSKEEYVPWRELMKGSKYF